MESRDKSFSELKSELRYKLCNFKSKKDYKREKKRKGTAQALKFLRKLGSKLKVPHKIRPKIGSFNKRARKASDLSSDEKISPRIALMSLSKGRRRTGENFKFELHIATNPDMCDQIIKEEHRDDTAVKEPGSGTRIKFAFGDSCKRGIESRIESSFKKKRNGGTTGRSTDKKIKDEDAVMSGEEEEGKLEEYKLNSETPKSEGDVEWDVEEEEDDDEEVDDLYGELEDIKSPISRRKEIKPELDEIEN